MSLGASFPFSFSGSEPEAPVRGGAARLDPSPAWLDWPDVTRRLEWEAVFGRGGPVELDLGAGDGGFVVGRALAHPERNFLAVERLLGRARKIARKGVRQGVGNVQVLRLESSYVVEWLVPEGSVALIHLMFPDPWPKKRHWKRRIMQPAFVANVARALEAGGEFRFTTDHEAYFAAACEVADACPELEAAAVWEHEADPCTEFQVQWEAEGRPTFRRRWTRKPRAGAEGLRAAR